MTYQEQLLDPRWQKKRLQILERDKWACQSCFNDKETLHVHHMIYQDCPAWDSDEKTLITVCTTCHNGLHSEKENIVATIFLRLWFVLWFTYPIHNG